MKKYPFFLAALVFSAANLFAQVENKALNFTPESSVDCGILPAFPDPSSYSIQFWFKPLNPKPDAKLLSIGNDCSVSIENDTTILFKNGDKILTASGIIPNQWNQVTLLSNEGNAKVIVNDSIKTEGVLSLISSSDAPLRLGGGYGGLLDEVRIWNAPLNDEMKTFDYFTHNTLNKWCPMWDNLEVYYKMDQPSPDFILDYKSIENPELSSNHGILSEGVSKVTADNPDLPYLINAAYTDSRRFHEKNIPAEQFYLSNQIIILGADVYAEDGRIEVRQPEIIDYVKDLCKDRAGMTYYFAVAGLYNPKEKFGDWREILYDKDKRERFASDLASISKDYDGVELDLEWIEVPEQWEYFGELAQEIREKLPPGKEFRISLHNNYTDFPVCKMDFVDGFTFQQYGPNPKNFSYDNFTKNVDKFLTKFDPSKILTSYATTTSRGANGSPVSRVRNGMVDNYQINYNDTDVFTDGEDTWSFMGPMQVYRRAKHTREKDLAGIFYWDMGCDNHDISDKGKEISEFNSARFCSYGINANNEPVINIQKP